MLKAIVFDFDGVIIDTEYVWYDMYREWLKKDYNYELQIKDYLVCVGSNSDGLFEFLKKNIGDYVDGEAFEKNIMEEFIQRTRDLPLMEGVAELIKEAKENGLKIALATSATQKKPKFHLERLGLMQYFDVLSTAELSKRIKPEPDIFLKAAEMLECASEECLAVEDSENGLLSAKRADMPCLVVPNRITRYSVFDGAYKIVDSLKEVSLTEVIEDFKK